MRIFPCHMITPHALSSAASRGCSEARGLGRNASIGTSSSMATPTIIPPASSATDPPYPRMVPSSTASVSSTIDLPLDSEDGEESIVASVLDDGLLTAAPHLVLHSAVPAPVTVTDVAVAGDEAAWWDDVNQGGRSMLQRSPAGALPRVVPQAVAPSSELRLPAGALPRAPQKAAAQPSQLRQPKPRLERRAASPPAASGVAKNGGSQRAASPEVPKNGGISGSARLLALRTHLEKNLKSAEDGLNDDLKHLDQRLSNRRTSPGEAPVA